MGDVSAATSHIIQTHSKLGLLPKQQIGKGEDNLWRAPSNGSDSPLVFPHTHTHIYIPCYLFSFFFFFGSEVFGSACAQLDQSPRWLVKGTPPTGTMGWIHKEFTFLRPDPINRTLINFAGNKPYITNRTSVGTLDDCDYSNAYVEIDIYTIFMWWFFLDVGFLLPNHGGSESDSFCFLFKPFSSNQHPWLFFSASLLYLNWIITLE